MIFEVRARYSGISDHRDLTAGGISVTGATGLQVEASDQVAISLELFYAPLSIVRPPASASSNEGLLNLRGMVSWRIR